MKMVLLARIVKKKAIIKDSVPNWQQSSLVKVMWNRLSS